MNHGDIHIQNYNKCKLNHFKLMNQYKKMRNRFFS